MVMANRLAIELGDFSEEEAARVERLLARYGLPTDYAIESAEAFYDRFFLDKKSQDNKITFIVPRRIGSFEMVKDPAKEVVMRVLKAFERG
jgi:3-dehydroquinate synthase